MRAALLLALLVLAPGAASVDASPELLRNGRFDTWSLGGTGPCPDSWRCSLPPAVGAVAPSVRYVSAPLAVALPELAWVQQDVLGQPGLTYTLRFWYQHPQAGHCMAVLRLLFYDAAGEFLERPTDHIMEDVPAWTERVLTATAPPRTAMVRVHLAGGCLADPPGVFLVDNVSLRAA